MQLQQAQKMEAVGQLTGGIAHDFNNLLAIIVNVWICWTRCFNPIQKAQAMAQDALGASLRGADLTRQLLAFSRRQVLEPKVLWLNDVVSGTMQLLRRTLGERVKIQMRLANDLARLWRIARRWNPRLPTWQSIPATQCQKAAF